MHILLLVVGIGLIGFLLWLNFGGNTFPVAGGNAAKDAKNAQNTDGIFVILSRDKRREVNAALHKKGRPPGWNATRALACWPWKTASN